VKLTKLGHSCVLIETENNSALFDPGGWADKNLIESIVHVDSIVYTHEHADHFSIDILQSLTIRFPDVQVVCNESIQDKIIAAGLQVAVITETELAVKFTSAHEQLPIPGSTPPMQNGYHYNDVFTHPGDSQSFTESKKVLAMPFIGPWGKTRDSVERVLALKPEFVLPIHDWHYTDEAKEWLQGILHSIFANTETTLLPNVNGQVIELQ
jgi:L-ascorbate metabolism protein UlaG (beta-lactamase superfamily)